MKIVIEKSFEGEFRVVLRNNDDDNDLITMPWVVRETTAMQQFAKVLANWVDVKYALQTNTPMSQEYLKKVINGTFKIFW